MSQTTPTVKELTNAYMVDIPCEKIKNVFAAELSWLEKSFGRARMGKDTNSDGSSYDFPALEQRFNEDWYEAYPNDNITSYSFIHVNSDTINIQSLTSNSFKMVADVSLIFWFNKNKIDTSMGADITQAIRFEIQKVIAEKIQFLSLTGGQVFDELEDVFSDYSPGQVQSEFRDHNVFGQLKLNGTIEYNGNCSQGVYPFNLVTTYDPFAPFNFIYSGKNFITY